MGDDTKKSEERLFTVWVPDDRLEPLSEEYCRASGAIAFVGRRGIATFVFAKTQDEAVREVKEWIERFLQIKQSVPLDLSLVAERLRIASDRGKFNQEIGELWEKAKAGQEDIVAVAVKEIFSDNNYYHIHSRESFGFVLAADLCFGEKLTCIVERLFDRFQSLVKAGEDGESGTIERAVSFMDVASPMVHRLSKKYARDADTALAKLARAVSGYAVDAEDAMLCRLAEVSARLLLSIPGRLPELLQVLEHDQKCRALSDRINKLMEPP